MKEAEKRWCGLLLFFSSCLYFNGLVCLPLAMAASISLTRPLIVPVLSARSLNEPVGPRRWPMVMVGFAGALIVIRPVRADFNWHLLLIFGSTLCSARDQRFTRRYCQAELPDRSANMATIVGAVVASPFLPFNWIAPGPPGHWSPFAGMGVMAGVGHYVLTMAYSQAPAAIVAPFNYFQLLGAALLSWLSFDGLPNFWSWGGTTVIMSSRPYIGRRERLRYREAQQTALRAFSAVPSLKK